MIRVVLSVLLFSSLLLSASEQNNYDILQRSVNFVIFASILYYLIANPIKNFFKNRSDLIAQKLEKVQEALKDSMKAKDEAESKLSKAKEVAKKIVTDSVKENEIIVGKILEDKNNEIKILSKYYEDLMMFEQRKAVREIVQEVLENSLFDGNVVLNENSIINLVLKKVA